MDKKESTQLIQKGGMIETQPNEKRCSELIESHILELPSCCPISGNPQGGSEIEISYRPGELLLEVASLRKYVDSYVNGRGEVRSMEGMVQQITQDCADVLRVVVKITARLILEPQQRMKLETRATPQKAVNLQGQ